MGIIRRLTLSICALLAACAVAPASLKKVTSPQVLDLPHAVFYTHQGDQPIEKRYYAGLLAGAYTAEWEDENGTYFRGPSRSVIYADDPVARVQYIAAGGIWIGKGGATTRYRLYRYIGTEMTRPRSDVPGAQGSIAGQTNGASPPQPVIVPIAPALTAGATPVQAGLGVGIAGALIDLTKGMDDGKIALQRDDAPAGIFDGQFVRR